MPKPRSTALTPGGGRPLGGPHAVTVRFRRSESPFTRYVSPIRADRSLCVALLTGPGKTENQKRPYTANVQRRDWPGADGLRAKDYTTCTTWVWRQAAAS